MLSCFITSWLHRSFCFLWEFLRWFLTSQNDLWHNVCCFFLLNAELGCVVTQEVAVRSTNHNGRNPEGLTVAETSSLSSLSGIYPACGYASPVIKFVGEPSYKPAGRLKPLGVLLSSHYDTKQLSGRWTAESHSDWLLLLEMCNVHMLRWTPQTYLAAGPSTDSCHRT